jgi:hypothetical protein
MARTALLELVVRVVPGPMVVGLEVLEEAGILPIPVVRLAPCRGAEEEGQAVMGSIMEPWG